MRNERTCAAIGKRTFFSFLLLFLFWLRTFIIVYRDSDTRNVKPVRHHNTFQTPGSASVWYTTWGIQSSSPLRVLVVSHDFQLQGAQMFVVRLASSLKQENVFVTVLSPVSGPIEAKLAEAEVPYVINPEINDYCRKHTNDYDIFQFNTLVMCTFVTLPQISKPLILSVHESDTRPFMDLLKACSPDVTKIFQRPDWITFPTSTTQNTYANDEYFSNHLASSSVVRYGVNFSPYSSFLASTSIADARRLLHLHPHASVVLTVGSIEPRKGQLTILKALLELKAKRPDMNLVYVLVGSHHDASYVQSIMELGNRSGGALTLTFAGVTNDTRPYYRASDIHVLHASAESLPFCLIEASLMAVPNVATRNQGIPEIIVDKTTGFLYNEFPELVSSLQTLLLSSETRAAMGISAQKFVSTKFPIQQMAQSYAAIYDHTILMRSNLSGIQLQKPNIATVRNCLRRFDHFLKVSNHRPAVISYHVGRLVAEDSFFEIETNVRLFFDSLVYVRDDAFVIANVDGELNALADIALEMKERLHLDNVCFVTWRETKSDLLTHAATAAYLGPRAQNFGYFFALNQGVRGPLSSTRTWIREFTDLFQTPLVKLVGATISCEISPHVQTHFFALSADVLRLFIVHELGGPPTSNWSDVIMHGEIGLTHLILKHGYHISSMLYSRRFRQMQFSECAATLQMNNPTGWCDLSYNDVVFMKWGGSAMRQRHYCNVTVNMANNRLEELAETNENLVQRHAASATMARHWNYVSFIRFLNCTSNSQTLWCPKLQRCVTSRSLCPDGPTCTLPLLYPSNIRTGLTNQLMNIRDVTAAASASGASVLLPPIGFRISASFTAHTLWSPEPFDRLFDADHFKNSTSQWTCAFSGIPLSYFQSNEITVKDVVHAQLNATAWKKWKVGVLLRSDVKVVDIPNAWESFDLDSSLSSKQLAAHFLEWFEPSRVYQAYIDDILVQLPLKFYCLHLRAEADWPHRPVAASHISKLLGKCMHASCVLYIGGGWGKVSEMITLSNTYFTTLCTIQSWNCLTKDDVLNRSFEFDIGGLVDLYVLSSPNCAHFWGYEHSTLSGAVAMMRINPSSFVDGHPEKTYGLVPQNLV